MGPLRWQRAVGQLCGVLIVSLAGAAGTQPSIKVKLAEGVTFVQEADFDTEGQPIELRLTTPPTDPVSILAMPAPGGLISVKTPAIVFNSTNFNVPQHIYLVGDQDDFQNPTLYGGSVQLSITTLDPNYVRPVLTVPMSVQDNDKGLS